MRVIIVTTLVTLIVGLAPGRDAEGLPPAPLPGGPGVSQEVHEQRQDAFRHRQAMAAVLVSHHTSLGAQEVLQAWLRSPLANQLAVVRAVEQFGKPYRYASRGPGAFDCSGLVHYAWRGAGTTLPANSRSQIRSAAPTGGEWLPGDLLYYPGHIMLSLGVGDHVVHAANRSTGVIFGRAHRATRSGRVLT